MPKQIHNIQQFHGGLSSNSDPRDINDTELSSATDVMVDEIGKIRTMGGTTAHDASTSTAIQIEPGYGLFKWSHDRLYAHLGEHLAEGEDFTDNVTLMSDMLTPGQKTFLADALDDDDDVFDFGGNTTGGASLLDGTNGFTAANDATFDVNSGGGRIVNSAATQGVVTIPIITVANRTYQVEFDVLSVSGGEVEVSLGTSAAYNVSNKVTSAGAAIGLTLDVPYKANDTTSFLSIRLSTSTIDANARIDNLKITLLPWDVTGDFSVNSTNATYTNSTNAGTLIQTAANRPEVGIANKTYIFTYTISSWSNGSITTFRIKGTGSEFAAAHTNLEQSNGTHSVTFTSHASNPSQPFTIDVVSDGEASFNIDDVSLRLYDVAETGDDYLVLADGEASDPALYLYSKNEDDWSNFQVITLGSTSNPKPSFYSIDGNLRVSDGNFGSGNLNQWYGYIDRTLFEELEPSYTINQWFNAPQKIEKPASCFYNDNTSFGDVYGDSATTVGSDSASSVSQGSFSGQDEIIKVKITTRAWIRPPLEDWFNALDVNLVVRVGTYSNSAWVTYQDIVMLTGWEYGGYNTAVKFAYFDAADTTVGDWGGDSEADTFRAEIIDDTNINTSGIMEMITYEAGTPPSDLSASLDNNNAFVEFDWEGDTGASGWRTAVAGSGKWEIGFSFIYDEIQESQISVAGDVSTGSTTLTVPAPHDATTAPSIRLFFADWNNVDDPWNKRITGCNMYMRDVAQTTTQSWFLQVSMDFLKGKALVATSQKEFDAIYYAESNQPYYYFEIGKGQGNDCEMLEPSLVTTYEVKSGLDAIEKSVISQYRSAVVVGRRVYVGGLMVENEDDSKDVMADAMIKTPVNKFDVFPLSRMIEASVRDGDEIIKLEEYADRILQFKKNKVHIINVSQEIEFLEDTFTHKGISHPAATCKTDFGVAWVNKLGCYIYDGQKVTNLLEKGGRQIIKESEWATFTQNEPMIGYIPKKRQLIVVDDITTNGDGSTFLYDMVTQSWVKGTTGTFPNQNKTNFVTDWNGDLVYVHSTGTVLKWDDASYPSGSFEMITKDIDLGQPGQRKKLHKVYVTYKGATATNVDVYFDVDGGTSLNKTFANGTNFNSNELAASASWAVAELKPTTSAQANNIKSFRLKFVAESGQTVPSDFEINDISAVYRLKNVK